MNHVYCGLCELVKSHGTYDNNIKKICIKHIALFFIKYFIRNIIYGHENTLSLKMFRLW